jgi:mannose-6-phosphate isomerase-like protein (cupin superfamily)
VSAGWEVARLDDLEMLPGPGTLRWTPLRRRFGLTAFGINAYTASEAGQEVVEPHTERSLGHEEVYAVVAGRASFVLDGQEVEVPAGGLVVIRDPGVHRAATAFEPGTTVLAIGGAPGSHEPSAWEYHFAAYARSDAGDHDGARAELESGLAAKGEHAVLLYHLACIECRAGRTEEGRRNLVRALELQPDLREWAADDEDLEAVGDVLGDAPT